MNPYTISDYIQLVKLETSSPGVFTTRIQTIGNVPPILQNAIDEANSAASYLFGVGGGVPSQMLLLINNWLAELISQARKRGLSEDEIYKQTGGIAGVQLPPTVANYFPPSAAINVDDSDDEQTVQVINNSTMAVAIPVMPSTAIISPFNLLGQTTNLRIDSVGTPSIVTAVDGSQNSKTAAAIDAGNAGTAGVSTTSNIDDGNEGHEQSISPKFDPVHKYVGTLPNGRKVYQLTDENGALVEWMILAGETDSRAAIDSSIHYVSAKSPSYLKADGSPFDNTTSGPIIYDPRNDIPGGGMSDTSSAGFSPTNPDLRNDGSSAYAPYVSPYTGQILPNVPVKQRPPNPELSQDERDLDNGTSSPVSGPITIPKILGAVILALLTK